MGWIQTYTGRKVDPANMTADDVRIEDIAHALALKCRYTGHCREFYSVAQHSILVAQNVPPEAALWALLHDAHEAYLADLSRPVKEWIRSTGQTFWDELEARIDAAVVAKFKLPLPCPPEVKAADTLLLTTEARAFFGGTKAYEEWHHRPENGFRMIVPPIIGCWDWRMAEREFLKAFSLLVGQNHV